MGKPLKSARESALDMLSRRALSEHEVRERLARKGYDAAQTSDALELVKSYGYVDDTKLAAAIARTAQRSARGPLWVRQKLTQRGINTDTATVQDAQSRDSGQNEAETATLALEKYLATRGEGLLADPRGRQKVMRHLLARGFSARVALAALQTKAKHA